MKVHGVVFGSLLLSLASLVGAAQVAGPSPQVDEAGRQAAYRDAGMRLATALQVWYDATPSRCDDGQSAYRCSGVIARGTRQSLPAGQYAWEPYPRGRTLYTSFSFLRADIKMPRLAWNYTNGFIISAPEHLTVGCFFPVDAVSDQRTDDGCGPNPGYPYTYSLCDVLPADPMVRNRSSEEYQWTLDRLAQLWITWDELQYHDTKRCCSFELRDRHAPQRFEIAVAAAAKASRLTDIPNDLKIQTWNPGHDPRLPIQAFFYINAQGKPFAELDRDQFERMTQVHLPVLKVTFPVEREGRILFEFGE
ncbi:hypothetical protein ACX3YG_19515 [Pseudomonas wadenswilerensis]